MTKVKSSALGISTLASRFEGSRRVSDVLLQPPLVSIIVVAFRDREEVAALIDNIAPYRGPEVELVIIDGKSDDGTLELLQASNAAVDYWLSEPDSGIYEAMNKGIAAARGNYILHLNAGDRLIAIPYEFLKECAAKNVDVICCRVLEDGSRVFTPRNSWQLRLYNTWHHQGTFFRRAAHLGYDPRYRIFGDFEHNQRMLNAGKSIMRSSYIVSEHRTGGASADTGMQKEIYRAIRRNFGCSFVALAFGRFTLSVWRRRLHVY